MLARLLRDPILHFIAAGFVLFLLSSVVARPEQQQENDRLIRVDRATLLTFMQYQSNAFDAASFERALDSMGNDELQQLIDDYVSEEVLYREATALGLEQSDYIIRRRMVDKMRFLLTDLAGADTAPTTAELQAWLEQNPGLYRIEPSASFTHVFIDASSSGQQQALQQANVLMANLNESHVGFNDASAHGDRFPFLRNYVERTLDFVSGHFGKAFADALARLEPNAERWQGPLQSDYGYHLVLLTTLTPGRDPTLEEVATNVARDLSAMRSEERLQQMVQDVRGQYEVETSDILQEEE
jgi:hypothetical protein